MDRDRARRYELQAQVVQAVAHPIRLAIVDYLADGEQCVCDIAEAVEAQRSNVSRHLSLMAAAGIVDCRKDGLRVIYRLSTPCVRNFLRCVTRVLEERIKSETAALAR
jgi:ArsR family transcriptional regulator